mmetsp:Transcript_37438/g.94112  ORF Transcript_37438/g.94112 Transcript_37438/m.94112 type:complete len:242 (+) Transcript_37438:804-1529(+)
MVHAVDFLLARIRQHLLWLLLLGIHRKTRCVWIVPRSRHITEIVRVLVRLLLGSDQQVCSLGHGAKLRHLPPGGAALAGALHASVDVPGDVVLARSWNHPFRIQLPLVGQGGARRELVRGAVVIVLPGRPVSVHRDGVRARTGILPGRKLVLDVDGRLPEVAGELGHVERGLGLGPGDDLPAIAVLVLAGPRGVAPVAGVAHYEVGHVSVLGVGLLAREQLHGRDGWGRFVQHLKNWPIRR